jgi:hypothetical protein
MELVEDLTAANGVGQNSSRTMLIISLGTFLPLSTELLFHMKIIISAVEPR